LSEPTVIFDSLEDWKGGSNVGYYLPKTNTIHILKGEYQEQRTLKHELIHAARRNKWTFKLASISNNHITTALLGSLFVVALVLQTYSLSIFAGLFLVIGLLAVIVEENEAVKGEIKKCHN
jgi:hypothetical protein